MTRPPIALFLSLILNIARETAAFLSFVPGPLWPSNNSLDINNWKSTLYSQVMDYPESSNDVAKWEKMYEENAPKQRSQDEEKRIFNLEKSEVRVVTFDLDNTIWKTSAVINYANDELAKYLDSIGMEAPVRVENIMGILFKSNKAKYCPIQAKEHGHANMDHIKAPVLLTQLRKDAIMEVLRNQTTKLGDDLVETMAEEAFAVWAKARHAAIPANLASTVVQSLREIRQLTTTGGKRLVVGAITDGNSDPRLVDLLEEHFDFVINAESVGVPKPDRRVYDAAIAHVCSHADLNHVFNGCSCDNFDYLMDMLGPWWVHVGDDFVKDIVAAKDLKMRCIWSRELVLDKIPKVNDQTRSPQTKEEDLRKKIVEGKPLRMIIGTEDYLTESLFDDFSDAIVDEFSQVAKIIKQWHLEGIEAGGQTISKEVASPQYFSITTPDEGVTPNGNVGDMLNEKKSMMETKFCMECGEKLPRIAKFCFSCGTQQPSLE